jgi:hypothetical protein
MWILHGSWLPAVKRFALWGEDTTVTPEYQKGKRGKTARHPYMMTQDALLKLLTRYTTDSDPDGQSTTIWLPGAGKDAQPSPQAQAAGVMPPDDELSLLAWKVDTLLLSATDALDFLLQLSELEDKRGMIYGTDFAFWEQATLLAMNALAEGRYIPTLEKHGQSYFARWQARLDPTLKAQLAANMPPLCRALVEQLSDAPEPHALLDSFFSATIDTFVREAFAARKIRPSHPWLRALTNADAFVNLSSGKLQKLYEAWQRWRAVEADDTGGLRVCFRLVAPSEDDDSWRVDYVLQATDDPSLLIDALQVWRARASTMTYLQRRFDRPQERLLAKPNL